MSKTHFKFLIPTTLLLGFLGCAHHKDVRPGSDGVHRVVVRAPDKEEAERKAIDEANHFCEQTKKYAAFIEEKTQYTGSMNENTRDTIHKASTAAMILGGPGGSRRGGNPVGDAGTAGYIMTGGKDYVADMKFRCQ